MITERKGKKCIMEKKEESTMKDNLLKIINHFGIDNQRRKMHEETLELLDAVNEYNLLKNESILESIVDEISDCKVVLEQIQHYFNISDERIRRRMKFKISRTLERISANFYENNQKNKKEEGIFINYGEY